MRKIVFRSRISSFVLESAYWKKKKKVRCEWLNRRKCHVTSSSSRSRICELSDFVNFPLKKYILDFSTDVIDAIASTSTFTLLKLIHLIFYFKKFVPFSGCVALFMWTFNPTCRHIIIIHVVTFKNLFHLMFTFPQTNNFLKCAWS